MDGSNAGGDGSGVGGRNQVSSDGGTGFGIARHRRLEAITQPQGLIRPDTPPPTRSLLLDFAAAEQESNEEQPLTRSPPGYSSSVSLIKI